MQNIPFNSYILQTDVHLNFFLQILLEEQLVHLPYYVVTFLWIWILKQLYVSCGKPNVIKNFKGREKNPKKHSLANVSGQ